MTVEKVSIEQVISAIKTLQKNGINDVTVQDIRETLGRGRVLDIARILPIAREQLSQARGVEAKAGTELPNQLQEAVEYLWSQMLRASRGEPEPSELAGVESIHQIKRDLHAAGRRCNDFQTQVEELNRELVHHSEAEQQYRRELENSNRQLKSLQSDYEKVKLQCADDEYRLRSENQLLKLQLEKAEKVAEDELKRRERLESEQMRINTESQNRSSQLIKDNQQVQDELARTRHDLDTVSRIKSRLESELMNMQRVIDQQQKKHDSERENALGDRNRLLERIERIEKLVP